MQLEHAISFSREGDGIGWDTVKNMYCIYKLTEGSPKHVLPEFLAMRKGMWPVPLAETAVEALTSLMRSKLQ